MAGEFSSPVGGATGLLEGCRVVEEDAPQPAKGNMKERIIKMPKMDRKSFLFPVMLTLPF